MKKLTKPQLEGLKKRMREKFPDDKMADLTGDDGMAMWWSSVSARLQAKMLEIDRDQMRSAAVSLTKFVR